MKTIALQQCEEERGEWEHEHEQGVHGEVDEVIGLHAGERHDSVLHLPVKSRHLPFDHLSQLHEVILQAKV
jgi:hypothetical protein